VTESSTAKSDSRSPRTRVESRRNPVSRAFASLSLFVRQVLAELRKVVRPTGSELINYTVVVILFVLAIMGIVAALDWVLHRLVLFVFAGT